MEFTITPYNIELQPTDIKITIYTAGCVSTASAGVTVHEELIGRDEENQHPISAITELQDSLDAKEDILGYTPENIANKKTDLSDNSDTYYPTQKAVKTITDVKADKSNVLELDNSDEFTPTEDYQPATKKYVDDNGGGGGFTEQALIDAATITWDFSAGNLGTVTIAGDRLFGNPTNLVVNQYLMVEITQGTGGSHVATFDTYFTFSGGIVPILSSVEGQKDRLWFLVRSATEISFEGAQFNV